MKKLFSLFLVLVLCIGIVSCKENEASDEDDTASDALTSEQVEESVFESDSETVLESEEESETEPEPLEWNTYALKDHVENVKVLGRSRMLDNGITCDYTASGIEFKVFCEDTVKLTLTATAETYYTVIVNGERSSIRFKAPSGQITLNLASFNSPGERTICVLKQTEAQNSLSVLETIEVKGRLLEAPEEKDLFIEFLGDSITCGYGNMYTGSGSPGNAFSQDGTNTFAFLACEKLNADYSMVCVSGIGLVQGYRDFTMGTCYYKDSYYRDSETDFDPLRKADVVVINLGTNDDSKSANTTAFVNAVKITVSQVRENYGKNVIIVWAYDMMKDGYQDHVRTALEALGGEEAGLYMCQLTRNTSGGGGHPNIEAHVSSANTLAKFIEEILN